MKKQISTFVGLLIVITVLSITAIHAQSPTTGRAHIPFDFSVGNQRVAAGDYAIERINGWVWMLRGGYNGQNMFLLTTATEPAKAIGDGKLMFHRYGERYFLSAFETSYYKIGLAKSAAEKSLEKEIKNDRLAKNLMSAKAEIVVIKGAM